MPTYKWRFPPETRRARARCAPPISTSATSRCGTCTAPLPSPSGCPAVSSADRLRAAAVAERAGDALYQLGDRHPAIGQRVGGDARVQLSRSESDADGANQLGGMTGQVLVVDGHDHVRVGTSDSVESA